MVLTFESMDYVITSNHSVKTTEESFCTVLFVSKYTRVSLRRFYYLETGRCLETTKC